PHRDRPAGMGHLGRPSACLIPWPTLLRRGPSLATSLSIHCRLARAVLTYGRNLSVTRGVGPRKRKSNEHARRDYGSTSGSGDVPCGSSSAVTLRTASERALRIRGSRF